MSIEAYYKQQQSLKLQKNLLRIEAKKAAGHENYSPASEVLGEMRKIINGAKVAKRE